MMLARQDFHVRYRRASLGVLWAVGLPVIQAVVLAVVFSRVVRVPATGNYTVFLFAGVLPWSFFSTVITGAATSIVDGQALATKVYFPRAVLPLVTVAANLYGFAPSLAVLIAMALLLGAPFGAALLLLVPGCVLMIVLSSAMALVLAAMQVYFRDVRYILTAIVLVWFYATPIIYPVKLAPHSLRPVLELNPATGMVELFRASVVAADPRWGVPLAWSCVWALAFLLIALELHRRFDRVFIDLL